MSYQPFWNLGVKWKKFDQVRFKRLDAEALAQLDAMLDG
jgi:hypothetical protein